MPTPILTTKLFIPKLRTELIPRSQIIRRLQEGRTRRLSLISAPAGFGKTTLATHWLSQHGGLVAWVSLDESDNDPIRFFSYIFSALQSVAPHIGKGYVENLQNTNPPSIEELTIYLGNDLAELKQEVILSLDDYHVINSRVIHGILDFLLEKSIPKIRFLIISRTEPPLCIAKLRARNLLVEINSNDLRFNNAEANLYLNRTMQLKLSNDDVEILESKTEGWITGLQLAALFLKTPSVDSKAIHNISGSNRFFSDYLLGEVLSQQPIDIQRFLLRTAFLDRLHADLCNALLDIDNSQSTLEFIEKSNLFLFPLDNNRQWYRYHHLFAEMLRTRFKNNHNDELPSLYWKAYEWHKRNEFLEDSVNYALKGKYYEEAADIVEKNGNQIYWRNRAHTIRNWLHCMPIQFLWTRPDLLILKVYLHLEWGQMELAEEVVNELKSRLPEFTHLSPDEYQTFQGQIMGVETAVVCHSYMDGARGKDIAEMALRLIPSDHHHERCMAYFHGGDFLTQLGELKEAREYLQNAVILSRQTDNQIGHLMALTNRGLLEFVAGALHIAEQYFLEAYSIAHKINVRQKLTYATALSGLSELYYEWNDLKTAAMYVENCIRLVDQGDFLDRSFLGFKAKIFLHSAYGNYDVARQSLVNFKKLIDRYTMPQKIIYKVDAIETRIDLLEGNMPKASVWADRVLNEFSGDCTFEREFELLTLSKVLIERQEHAEAIELLNSLLSLAHGQGRINSMIHIEVTMAKAYCLIYDTANSLEHLQRALLLGEKEGYVRAFLDEGEPIKELLSQFQSNQTTSKGPSTSYVQMLLQHFTPKDNIIDDSECDRLMRLTPREMEVLHLLAEGHSYNGIADKLFVSVNTIRTHIKGIYSKMGANNRVQVLRNARKKNLIK